ncbi:hypothetical protein LTR50_004141 [Elasticomyces elasticus]|nr:hypothetical protein LTR50_004141 [Elasticomyces elasticus]
MRPALQTWRAHFKLNRHIAPPQRKNLELFPRGVRTSTTTSRNASTPKRRGRTGILLVLATSALGGAAYRSYGSSGSSGSKQSLNTTSFTPFTLISKEPVSSTSSILTLQPQHGTLGNSIHDMWTIGVWSVQIKQPQLQIARAYTPLPPALTGPADASSAPLRLLVRKEHNGEVSGYLHRLSEGATVELRGPTLEYEIPQNVEEVLFLAGGTGIAPAMQVAHALAGRAKVHILWATRKREDCIGGVSDTRPLPASGWLFALKGMLGMQATADIPKTETSVGDKGLIVQQLEAMKREAATVEHQLSIDYFVDEESRFIQPETVSALVGCPDGKARATDQQGKKLIFVSGPDGFVKYWAGPKQWSGGREIQGPLGGMLSKLNLSGWEVVKL